MDWLDPARSELVGQALPLVATSVVPSEVEESLPDPLSEND